MFAEMDWIVSSEQWKGLEGNKTMRLQQCFVCVCLLVVAWLVLKKRTRD